MAFDCTLWKSVSLNNIWFSLQLNEILYSVPDYIFVLMLMKTQS